MRKISRPNRLENDNVIQKYTLANYIKIPKNRPTLTATDVCLPSSVLWLP